MLVLTFGDQDDQRVVSPLLCGIIRILCGSLTYKFLEYTLPLWEKSTLLKSTFLENLLRSDQQSLD